MVWSRYVLGAFIGGATASAWLLMAGNFTPRWQAMVDQVRRWYLVSTPLSPTDGGAHTRGLCRPRRSTTKPPSPTVGNTVQA